MCATSANRLAASTLHVTARLRDARGDVVAFTDDDAVPEREWLGGLMPNFQSPRVVCVTGLTLPLALDTEAQELFETHCTFVRGFRRRVFDGQTIIRSQSDLSVPERTWRCSGRRTCDLAGSMNGWTAGGRHDPAATTRCSRGCFAPAIVLSMTRRR